MPAKKKLTPEQIKIIQNCAGLGLTIEEISLILGIGRATLNRNLRDSDIIREAYNTGRAIAKRFVTEKLFDLIREGEPSAIYFYLKCQCSWREKEKDVVDTTASNITIYLPEKETDASK
jgi:hypothetical protein